MREYIFIPDTHKNAGLGHFYRCLNYASYLKELKKIYFLIDKNFSKSILNLNKSQQIIFIRQKKITKNSLKNFSNENKKIVFIDSYNKKLHNIVFNIPFVKKISLIDFKIPNNSQINIDHTFCRSKMFHIIKKSQKLYIGHKYFPHKYEEVKNNKKHKIKNIILINFGSVNKKKYIKESLIFLKRVNLNKQFKIIIINKYLKKKDLKIYKNLVHNKIIYFKYTNDLHKFYERTYFTIGGCGISLYERSFFHIPSIAKSVAINQRYNFKNFLVKKCILDYRQYIYGPNIKNCSKTIFLNDIYKIKRKLKKFFNKKINEEEIRNIFLNLK